jgi:hypothetical protein
LTILAPFSVPCFEKLWFRATFITKPGKSDYTETKAYHPVRLLSFLLKMMEMSVDRHISNGVLKEYPSHQNQHAYQTGKSTEIALQNVVTCTESATEYKKIALGAFLDIEQPFDRTSFDVIIQAVLEGRNIKTMLSG